MQDPLFWRCWVGEVGWTGEPVEISAAARRFIVPALAEPSVYMVKSTWIDDICSNVFSSLCAGWWSRPEIPGVVEKNWLVQNDETRQGGDGNKLKNWRWLSSSGRMVKSSVVLLQKLEWVTMQWEMQFPKESRFGWSTAVRRYFSLARTIICLLSV